MRVERTTAAILNERLELFSVPWPVSIVIVFVVALVWRITTWKIAAITFTLLALAGKELYKWDRDFLLLLPAILFFSIGRVFDPFEWEPFQIVIVEDLREKEE